MGLLTIWTQLSLNACARQTSTNRCIHFIDLTNHNDLEIYIPNQKIWSVFIDSTSL